MELFVVATVAAIGEVVGFYYIACYFDKKRSVMYTDEFDFDDEFEIWEW